MSKDRKFVGKGKKVGDYNLINISLAKSKLDGYWYEYNGEHYIKLTVGGLKEKDQYGKTHSVWIDDYKPDSTKSKSDSNVQEVDLPF
jgi:hypothetical protein